MKEKNALDGLFKERLAEHSSPVPDYIWEGVVAKRAHASKGGFGPGLIWLAVVGVLLVASGAYLSVSQLSGSIVDNSESASDRISKASLIEVDKPQLKENTEGSISPYAGSESIASDKSAMAGFGRVQKDPATIKATANSKVINCKQPSECRSANFATNNNGMTPRL